MTTLMSPSMTTVMVLALTGALSGCANSIFSDAMAAVTPYRVDIVQGNVVTREQIERVKVGLSRDEVRNVLGAPLLADAFHADRWDYSFTLRRDGKEQQRRNIVAWFDGDKLKKLDAPGDLPSEVEFVSAIGARRAAVAPRVLELTEAERQALPAPARPAATPAAPSGPTRPYPPLESTP